MQQEKSSTNVHFASRLQQLLSERGMSKAQLAEIVSVSPTAIGNYCNGRIPKADELLRISNAFGTTMEQLLTGQPSTLRVSGASESGTIKQVRAEVLRLAAHLDQAEASMSKLRTFLG